MGVPVLVEIKCEELAAWKAAEGCRTLLRPQGYAVGVEATLLWHPVASRKVEIQAEESCSMAVNYRVF